MDVQVGIPARRLYKVDMGFPGLLSVIFTVIRRSVCSVGLSHRKIWYPRDLDVPVTY